MNKTQKNLVLALAIGMFLLALAPNVNAACTSVSACGNITVSGCYTFTANVTYSTAGGVCSHILANDVRIDGNGFWLSSNAIATQGIIIENTTSSTRTNVTITNLVINNFTNAIVSTNKVSNLFVDNNRFYRNVRSIKLDNTNSSFITRNYISNVLGSTPKAQNDGNGIQVEINSRQTNVTNNQIYNVSNGINIGTGSGGTSAPSIIQGNIGSAFYQTDLGLGVGLGCDGCQYNSFNNNSMNISGYFTAGESRIANPNYQPKNNNWTNNNFFGIFNLNTTESPGVFILNNSNNTILFQNTIVASTFTAMTVINSSNLNFTSNRFGRTVYFGNSTGTILSSIIIDRNVFTKGEFPIPIGNDGITLQTSNNTIFRNNVLNYTEQLDYFAQPVLFLSQLNNSAIYNNTITRLSINNINSTANNSILNNTISISGALTPITITGLIPNHNSTLNSTVFANGTQTITLGTGIAGTANASAVLVNNSRRDTIYNNATASNSSIYQYWTRNWYVNQSGSPAAGANLTIRNDQNRQVFSCITDSNGWCNQTLHLQLFQNATLTDNHTVWNITATKSGQSNTTNVTVDFYGNFQMNLPATLTSACATITQNTTLGANIVGNAGGGACIRFGADNIELFCADKRIDGHATAAVDDFGVDTNGFDNIWIRNCTIQGFTHNIKITNSTGVTILDSHLSSPNAASSPTLSPYNVFFNSSNTANNVTIVNTFVTNATSTDVLVQNSIDNVTILNSTFSGGKTNLNGLYFTGNRLRVHNSTFFNYSEAIYYTDAVGTVRNQSIEFSNFTNNIYDNAQYCAFTYITSGVGICIQTSTNLDTLNISYSSFTNSHAALGFYQTSATHGGYIYGSNFSGNNYIVETDGAVILNFTNSSFQNYTGIVLDGRGFTSYGNGFLNVSGVDTSKIDCDAGECNYSIEWWKAVNVSYSDDLTPVGSASGRANSSRGKLFGPLYTTNASGIVQNIRVLQESGTRPSNVKVVETPWSFNASFGNINQTLDSTNQSNMILLLLNPRYPEYFNEDNPASFTYRDNYTQPLNWQIEWVGNDVLVQDPSFFFEGDNTTYLPQLVGGDYSNGQWLLEIYGLGQGLYASYWEGTNDQNNINTTSSYELTISQNSSYVKNVTHNGTQVTLGGQVTTNISTSNFSEFNYTKNTLEGIVRVWLNDTIMETLTNDSGRFHYTNTSPIQGYYNVSFEFCGDSKCLGIGNYTNSNFSFYWNVVAPLAHPRYYNQTNPANFTYSDNYTQPLTWSINWSTPLVQVNFWFDGGNTTYTPSLVSTQASLAYYQSNVSGLGRGTYTTFWNASNPEQQNQTTPTQLLISQNTTFVTSVTQNGSDVNLGGQANTNTSTSNFSEFNFSVNTLEGYVKLWLNNTLIVNPVTKTGNYYNYTNTTPAKGYYNLSFEYCGNSACDGSGNYSDRNYSFYWNVDFNYSTPISTNDSYPSDFVYYDNYTQPLNWNITWQANPAPLTQVNFWFDGGNTTYIPVSVVNNSPYFDYGTSIFGLPVGVYSTFWQAFNSVASNQSTTRSLNISQNSTFEFLTHHNGTQIMSLMQINTSTTTSNFSNWTWFKNTREGIVKMWLNNSLVNTSGWYLNTSPIQGYYLITYQFCGEPTCLNAGNYTDTNKTFYWAVDQPEGSSPPPSPSPPGGGGCISGGCGPGPTTVVTTTPTPIPTATPSSTPNPSVTSTPNPSGTPSGTPSVTSTPSVTASPTPESSVNPSVPGGSTQPELLGDHSLQCVAQTETVLNVERSVSVYEIEGKESTLIELRVTNQGQNDLKNVEFEETTPKGVSLSSIIFTPQPKNVNEELITWKIDTLRSGETALLSYKVQGRLIDFEKPKAKPYYALKNEFDYLPLVLIIILQLLVTAYLYNRKRKKDSLKEFEKRRKK